MVKFFTHKYKCRCFLCDVYRSTHNCKSLHSQWRTITLKQYTYTLLQSHQEKHNISIIKTLEKISREKLAAGSEQQPSSCLSQRGYRQLKIYSTSSPVKTYKILASTHVFLYTFVTQDLQILTTNQVLQ